jgi:hypothetical protein
VGSRQFVEQNAEVKFIQILKDGSALEVVNELEHRIDVKELISLVVPINVAQRTFLSNANLQADKEIDGALSCMFPHLLSIRTIVLPA